MTLRSFSLCLRQRRAMDGPRLHGVGHPFGGTRLQFGQGLAGIGLLTVSSTFRNFLKALSGKHLKGVARLLLAVEMKFPPDLIARVRGTLERVGFCFLSHDEIERVLANVPGGGHTRVRALHEFAELCGAEVETTIHLKSARFVPARVAQQNSAPPTFPRSALASG